MSCTLTNPIHIRDDDPVWTEHTSLSTLTCKKGRPSWISPMYVSLLKILISYTYVTGVILLLSRRICFHVLPSMKSWIDKSPLECTYVHQSTSTYWCSELYDVRRWPSRGGKTRPCRAGNDQLRVPAGADRGTTSQIPQGGSNLYSHFINLTKS